MQAVRMEARLIRDQDPHGALPVLLRGTAGSAVDIFSENPKESIRIRTARRETIGGLRTLNF